MNLPRWRTQIKWTSCSPVPLYTAGQVDVAHAQHWERIFRNQITLHGLHLPAFQVWHIVRDFFFLHKILSCPWSRLYNLYFVLVHGFHWVAIGLESTKSRGYFNVLSVLSEKNPTVLRCENTRQWQEDVDCENVREYHSKKVFHNASKSNQTYYSSVLKLLTNILLDLIICRLRMSTWSIGIDVEIVMWKQFGLHKSSSEQSSLQNPPPFRKSSSRVLE